MRHRSRSQLLLLLLSGVGGSALAQAEPGPTRVVAGAWHTCVLTAGGRVHCWGANSARQLGREGTEFCKVKKRRIPCVRAPLPVESELRFTRLTAGVRHTCGLTESGEAWCWGDNSRGQLGTDSTPGECVSAIDQHVFPCTATPIPVQGGLLFTALAAGDTHTCGLTLEGAVFCWGSNSHRQLGVGTPGPDCVNRSRCSRMPLRVDAKPFAALAVGGDLTCGLQASGLAWCWGAGNTTPARVPAKEHFSLLAVGLAGGAGVTAKGRTYWWHNPFVGTGTVVRDIDPAQRGLIRSVETHYTMVGIGATHVCGLTKDGTVYCWGDHSRGQLGRGDNWLGDLVAEAIVDELIPGVDDEADTVDPRDTLVHENTIRNADWRTIDRVPTRVRFEAIAAGYLHTCGLTSGGRVFCWGSNDEGQLGSANPELAYEPRETQPIEPDP